MAALWLLTAAIVTGLALAAIHLTARRPPTNLRLAAYAHGAAAAAGTALAIKALWPTPTPSNASSPLAVAFLVTALLLGAAVLIAQLRARPPSALVLTLHAIIGLGGFLLLLT